MDTERVTENENTEMNAGKMKPARIEVPSAVIRRLPRYFRYLRELLRQGIMRISSAELSRMMHVTASQIRQDLNCFGGFGQQGYGYNVQFLYDNICEILGVNGGFTAIIIGSGDLGRAIVRSPMFAKRGIEILSLFDVNEELIGKAPAGITIRHMNELSDFCRNRHVDMAVLTLPKNVAQEVADQICALGVSGIWNFTGMELTLPEHVMVENVHLGDSLMTLSYKLEAKRLDDMRDEEINPIHKN